MKRKYQICISIDEKTEAALRQAGAGNISAGVRQLAAEYAATAEPHKFQPLGKDGNAKLFTVPSAQDNKTNVSVDELDLI